MRSAALILLMILMIVGSCETEKKEGYRIAQNLLRFSVDDSLWRSDDWRDEVIVFGIPDTGFGISYYGRIEDKNCKTSAFLIQISGGIFPGDTLKGNELGKHRMFMKYGYDTDSCYVEYKNLKKGFFYCGPYSARQGGAEYYQYDFGATFELVLTSNAGDTLWIKDGIISVVQ